MSGRERELLDRTDRARRVLQLSVVWIGVALLFLAGAVLRESIQGRAGLIGGSFAVLGLAVMASGLLIKVRWDLDYKGHRIRFDNDPFTGERLFIDDVKVAKGGIGLRMVLTGVIPAGEGAGDVITAIAEAGLWKFRCRIVAEEAGAPEPAVLADSGAAPV